MLYMMASTKGNKTMTTEYIVRSAISPSSILCTDGEFHYEGFIGPGHSLRVKVYKTRRGAERFRGGFGIIVKEFRNGYEVEEAA